MSPESSSAAPAKRPRPKVEPKIESSALLPRDVVHKLAVMSAGDEATKADTLGACIEYGFGRYLEGRLGLPTDPTAA
jgi:hypothetical protein